MFKNKLILSGSWVCVFFLQTTFRQKVVWLVIPTPPLPPPTTIFGLDSS